MNRETELIFDLVRSENLEERFIELAAKTLPPRKFTAKFMESWFRDTIMDKLNSCINDSEHRMYGLLYMQWSFNKVIWKDVVKEYRKRAKAKAESYKPS